MIDPYSFAVGAATGAWALIVAYIVAETVWTRLHRRADRVRRFFIDIGQATLNAEMRVRVGEIPKWSR